MPSVVLVDALDGSDDLGVPDAAVGRAGEGANLAKGLLLVEQLCVLAPAIGAFLDAATLPELLVESRAGELRRSPSAKVQRMSTGADRRRGEAYMSSVIDGLEATVPGGRNDALNRAAWTLGRWIAAGALEQTDVEDELYDAAERNGLVGDDGDRQCWATIRSRLSAGLQQPADLDANA